MARGVGKGWAGFLGRDNRVTQAGDLKPQEGSPGPRGEQEENQGVCPGGLLRGCREDPSLEEGSGGSSAYSRHCWVMACLCL